jgi:hypothetical protein
MNCQECKGRLYPTDPTVGFSHEGRYYPPLCEGCPNQNSPEQEIERLKNRIEKLEELVAMPGSIPRRYQDRLQQLQGELAHVHSEVHEMKAKKKRQSKYA